MKLYTMDVKSRFDLFYFFLQTYEVEEKCTCTREWRCSSSNMLL